MKKTEYLSKSSGYYKLIIISGTVGPLELLHILEEESDKGWVMIQKESKVEEIMLWMRRK